MDAGTSSVWSPGPKLWLRQQLHSTASCLRFNVWHSPGECLASSALIGDTPFKNHLATFLSKEYVPYMKNGHDSQTKPSKRIEIVLFPGKSDRGSTNLDNLVFDSIFKAYQIISDHGQFIGNH